MTNSNWDESKHPRERICVGRCRTKVSKPEVTENRSELQRSVRTTGLSEANPRHEQGKFTDKGGSTVAAEEANKEKMQRRADILYPTMKDRIKQKVAEFGLGVAYDTFGYNYAKKHYGKDTVGMVDLAHENPKNPNYAANSIELNSYEDITNDSDREYFKEKITEQFKDYGYAPKSIEGRIYQENSEPSQRIAQDKDFLETIKANKEQILTGAKISGEFPRYNDNKKSNLHFAIGHYDLRNGYLDKRGNLHIDLCDTYEFNKDNHTPLNQAGRNQMIKGNLKPSFSMHKIVVPNYVMKEIWN